MSIAVQQALPSRSTAVAELDAGRGHRRAPASADDGGDRAAPNGRHALLDAVGDAIAAVFPRGDTSANGDAPPVDAHAAKQALHGFVHALFAELRPSGGEGGHGRGFAWGRTSAATIAQRLDDLVARLQAGSAAAPSPATDPATTKDAGAATAATATAATADDGATATTPAAAGEATSSTTAPAASVPSPSPLLTAFGQLATARGAGGVDGATSDALIAMLKRIASALGGDAGAVAPAAGGLLDATA